VRGFWNDKSSLRCLMPRRSDITGFRCTAVYEEGPCPGFMLCPTTIHPGSSETVRYRKCPYCGATQRTHELPDGPCHQPRVPIYRRKRQIDLRRLVQASLFPDE
jgi:hypothetical protein